MNWDELSLTLSSWPADYECKKKKRIRIPGKRPPQHTPTPLPRTFFLPTHTWTNPNGKKRSVCPWEPRWKVWRQSSMSAGNVQLYRSLLKFTLDSPKNSPDCERGWGWMQTRLHIARQPPPMPFGSGPSCSPSGPALWHALAKGPSANGRQAETCKVLQLQAPLSLDALGTLRLLGQWSRSLN